VEDVTPEPRHDDAPSAPLGDGHARWSRRSLLLAGFLSASVAGGAAFAGIELIDHDVLPGRQELEQLEGGCAVAEPVLRFGPVGPSRSGRFYSRARRRRVGYTIAWPPGHGPGDALPLVVMLHGYGGNHATALSGMRPDQAVALEEGGRPLPPLALVTVDGGGGYWNPHPDDDPMAMVMHELIPMCQDLGLGAPPMRIGTMGISMGGFGALLLAEKFPHRIDAVAAISPAIWTTYEEAAAANPGAFSSARAFATADAVTHANALTGLPVRVASGIDDPFQPGVRALVPALPKAAVVVISQGCHTAPFFTAQEPPSLRFLAGHLSR
jgi:pimeloyl-ACP methyl ester carboxylesterase